MFKTVPMFREHPVYTFIVQITLLPAPLRIITLSLSLVQHCTGNRVQLVLYYYIILQVIKSNNNPPSRNSSQTKQTPGEGARKRNTELLAEGREMLDLLLSSRIVVRIL